MHCAIQKAEVLDGAHLMQILWQDGTESFYPAVWLRDNCQCPSCYLDSAKARKFLVESLDVNIGIKDLSFDRKRVLITWPSEHYSEFEADWLKKRCFSQQAREKLQRELFFPDFLDWYQILQSEDFKQKEQWDGKANNHIIEHSQQSQVECLFEKRLPYMKPGLFDFRRNSGAMRNRPVELHACKRIAGIQEGAWDKGSEDLMPSQYLEHISTIEGVGNDPPTSCRRPAKSFGLALPRH